MIPKHLLQSQEPGPWKDHSNHCQARCYSAAFHTPLDLNNRGTMLASVCQNHVSGFQFSSDLFGCLNVSAKTPVKREHHICNKDEESYIRSWLLTQKNILFRITICGKLWSIQTHSIDLIFKTFTKIKKKNHLKG